jgi:hypothetical protein
MMSEGRIGIQRQRTEKVRKQGKNQCKNQEFTESAQEADKRSYAEG